MVEETQEEIVVQCECRNAEDIVRVTRWNDEDVIFIEFQKARPSSIPKIEVDFIFDLFRLGWKDAVTYRRQEYDQRRRTKQPWNEIVLSRKEADKLKDLLEKRSDD